MKRQKRNLKRKILKHKKRTPSFLLSLQKIQIMDFKEILKKFNNKYIIATLIFAVVIIFVDQYNLFYQIRNFKKRKEVRNKVEYYEKEIKQQQETLERLHRDSALMEKIAREKYMMKRDNEVIYVIEAKE